MGNRRAYWMKTEANVHFQMRKILWSARGRCASCDDADGNASEGEEKSAYHRSLSECEPRTARQRDVISEVSC